MAHKNPLGQEEQPETEQSGEVSDLINICKELVMLTKRTKLNGQLETTLKQCVATKWNSVLTTLKSVAVNLDNLRRLSTEAGAYRNLLRLLADINDKLLQNVVQILQPFDTATKYLSADKYATIHLVVATKCKLVQLLSISVNDGNIVGQLKRHLLAKLEHHFKISQFHYWASLLNPRQKSNGCLMTQDKKNAAINSLKVMVASAINSQANATATISTTESDSAINAQQPNKNQRFMQAQLIF